MTARPALGALAATLALAACAPGREAQRRTAIAEAADLRQRCELVRAVMGEAGPARAVAELRALEDDDGPAPLLVFRSSGGESPLLERFVPASAGCGASDFQVVQDAARRTVVLFLTPVDGGYAYEARVATPEELTPRATQPRERLVRSGDGWSSVTVD